MDWNRVEGNWKQVKGQVKEKWGKLTDDDLTAINGRRDQLEGKIQERYGLAKDQVKKDIANCQVSFALCFPDVYEIGMSHTGLGIIYDCLNRMEDVAAERVFAPWGDAEEVMREKKIPLFSLESKAALSSFDVVGFGAHGLLRVMDGDWNDGITLFAGNRRAFVNKGESVDLVVDMVAPSDKGTYKVVWSLRRGGGREGGHPHRQRRKNSVPEPFNKKDSRIQ